GIDELLVELKAIAQDVRPADFTNTFEALERGGQLLRRAVMAYWTVFSAHGTDDLREIDPQIQSMVSGHQDAIHLDGDLYARLASVDAAQLAGEEARLVSETL